MIVHFSLMEFLPSIFSFLSPFRFLQDPKDIANSQRFSKMARNKDNAEHSEVTGSTTSPIHHFSATSSTSPQMLSSSPLTSASTSTSASSSLRSSAMMSSSMAPSPLSSSRGYCLSTPGPHSSSIHVYPDPKDTCQSSSIGQRSSVHMASTSSTPSPSPPAAADDPVAIATHQMEGVSMMALASPWQGSVSGASDTKGQGLQVKEEPSSRPNSPDMVC